MTLTMPPPPTIVEVGPAHASVLAALHEQGFDVPWTVDAFVGTLATPGTIALMAQDDGGEPLGFVLIRAGGGEAEVLTILTRPQHRRAGIAQALMLSAQEKLREGQAEKLFLEVAIDNPAAHGLYKALGFTQVGRRTGYYERKNGARVDALILAYTL